MTYDYITVELGSGYRQKTPVALIFSIIDRWQDTEGDL